MHTAISHQQEISILKVKLKTLKICIQSVWMLRPEVSQNFGDCINFDPSLKKVKKKSKV